MDDKRWEKLTLSKDVIKAMRDIDTMDDTIHLLRGSSEEEWKGYSEVRKGAMTLIAKEIYKLCFDLSPEEESQINEASFSVKGIVALCKDHSERFVYEK